MNKKMNNKNGFVTIELILISGLIFALIAMFIGVIAYVSPIISIQREVSLLGDLARDNGGLTTAQVETFKAEMGNRGYLKECQLPVIVEGITEKGYNPIGIWGTRYIAKEDNDLMTFTVKVPSNNLISKFSSNASSYYEFSIGLMSERSRYD